VSLVDEVMPERASTFAFGRLHALSAVGNIASAVSSIILALLARAGITGESWRRMFLIGSVPAFLTIFIFRRLKEPERWQAIAAAQSIRQRLGAYFTELFQNPRWARHAV